jgi:hypothetical protein
MRAGGPNVGQREREERYAVNVEFKSNCGSQCVGVLIPPLQFWPSGGEMIAPTPPLDSPMVVEGDINF